MENITKHDFIAIWKKATNHPNIKPTITEHTYNGITTKTKTKGWIYPEHHIIYNLIRNKPIYLGFYCGDYPTEGFKDAYDNLKRSKGNVYFSNKLYAPFQEHINGETFTKIMDEIRLKIFESEM